MKTALFSVVLLLASSTVFAQSPATPKVMVESFFDTMQKGNVSLAFDQLLSGSSIPGDKPQAVTALKQQTQAGLPLYGKILGYEVVHEEQLSQSVVRYVYFLKSEKLPTTWEFYFYKPKSQWFLANILFNDQFNLLGVTK